MPDRGRVRERDEETFGPGWTYYLLPVLCLAVAALCLRGWAETASFETAALFLVLTVMSVAIALFFLLGQWVAFHLDRSGIERRALGSRRRWPWSSIGGVVGQEVQSPVMEGTTWTAPGPLGRAAGPLVRRVVVDRDGRPLFRISPWTAMPRDLAAEIRRRAGCEHP